MAFDQNDIDALDVAIKSRSQSVAYKDRSVTYRSLDEMLRLRELMAADVATGTRTAAGGIRVYPDYSKGC